MTQEQNTFIPYETLRHLLTNWWKIALLAVLFGMLGLATSYLIPPKYEAEAIFTATIDYRDINFENLQKENGKPLTITQYDYDLALSVVQTVLLQVKNDVIAYAQTLDPALDAQTFEDNMRIERRHAEWSLRYRHEDPAVAQAIVNYWAEVGLAQLEKAQESEVLAPYVKVDLTTLANLPGT
ncbi:MAG: Wzz/FepE/Etk N-terminal domain-containing protein, partial [Chloroflexota bacterium]|nr:Wzz/FepE/Etk N-terminal domain-containing protein [Chloroflexota bacterium]